jgi:PAS domain S-box
MSFISDFGIALLISHCITMVCQLIRHRWHEKERRRNRTVTTYPPTDGTNRFERLFNELNDAVVEFELVDGEPVIVQANATFVETFGHESESLSGVSLNDLIVPSDRREEAERFDKQTAAGESNAAVVERATADGRRQFVYRSVPIETAHAFAIYTDVTAELRRERHLDVLQRVLRHNLRNDVNVIGGQAEKISELADSDEIQAAAASITETAQGLAHLSEEAKTVHRVLGESPTIEPTEITAIIDRVVAACGERFPAATLTTDCPTALLVAADTNLRVLVESLVDNAVRHNTAAEPAVRVAAGVVDDATAKLSVTDNGPGIPATERDIITGDKEITPLHHGSGLGLWLVRWITDRYGAELRIKTPPSGGTTVCVEFDRALISA